MTQREIRMQIRPAPGGYDIVIYCKNDHPAFSFFEQVASKEEATAVAIRLWERYGCDGCMPYAWRAGVVMQPR